MLQDYGKNLKCLVSIFNYLKVPFVGQRAASAGQSHSLHKLDYLSSVPAAHKKPDVRAGICHPQHCGMGSGDRKLWASMWEYAGYQK